MIQVSSEILLNDNELQFDFIRASGPGGQNVNKVASAVQLRFDVIKSPSLPEEVRQRLLRIAHNRISEEGILVIEAKQHRTQEQNREQAVQRLVDLIRKATEKPKLRKATRPTAASRQRRVEAKRRRGEIKRRRKYRPGEEG